MSNTEQAYTFAAKPSAVAGSRKQGAGKAPYRQQQQQEKKDEPEVANIMYDPRVFRGSTYSSHARSKNAQADQAKAMRRRKASEKRRKEADEEQRATHQGDAPPAVPGHQHMDVQTDTYLEELTDRVPESNTETQTDPLMDRPSLPLFVPTKTGVDAETQVDVDELFDFDAEVEPILEVLVGKTLEHAMMEVLEEEELASIRAHQLDFEQERNVERAEVQRLEAEAVRRNQEKQRRVQQEKERMAREAEVIDKVAARAFASDYLSDLSDSVFDKLVESGKFYDPLIKEVEDDFLPWLVTSVQQTVSTRSVAQRLTDALIHRTLEKAKEMAAARKEEQAAKIKAQEQEAEQARAREAAQAAEDAESPEDQLTAEDPTAAEAE